MSDEGYKRIYREMRDGGQDREQMREFSRLCFCTGCIQPRSHGKACKCGKNCNCRCTLPEVVKAREADYARQTELIDEVLAE